MRATLDHNISAEQGHVHTCPQLALVGGQREGQADSTLVEGPEWGLSPKQMLTPVQVAERWQVSVQTLANQRSAGTGATYVKVGKSVRYRGADLLAYESACVVSAVMS